MNQTKPLILGAVHPNLIGQLLSTGYDEFHSPTGVNGLFKLDGATLHLLAVIATTPGVGQFRDFIQGCKAQFHTIYIWEIMNPVLNTILKKYDFWPCAIIQDGEHLNGWKWEAPATYEPHP